MSGSQQPQYQVHLGSWTNWSQGAILGATLTMTRSDANLLIAFVAFFVTAVGARVWRITCLVFHSIYSTDQPQDGLYYQRQAVLRNAASAEGGLPVLLDMAWAWRGRANRPFRRLAPPIIFSLLCLVGFMVASGFSSNIASSSSNEVLLSGSHCAVTDADSLFGAPATDLAGIYYPYVGREVENAANYAQQCYNSDHSRGLDCATFPKVRLPTTAKNISCPFDSGICKTDVNLLLDTGYINSHTHLGLNAPKSQRFEYRRVVRCAPLVTHGYASTYNLTDDKSWTRYYYGPAPSVSHNTSEFTYQYSNDIVPDERATNPSFTGTSFDYTIGVRRAYYYNGSLVGGISDLEPIPELQIPDADIMLFFLSANLVEYITPTNDPWYQATTPGYKIAYSSSPNNITYSSSDNKASLYFADEPASPLACAVQEQWCNPNKPEESKCGPLTTENESMDAAVASGVFSEGGGYNRLSWMNRAAWGVVPFMTDIVASLGSHSLTSRFGLGTVGVQGPIPDNQWQLDVQNWHAISMASIQSSLVQTVTGPPDGELMQFFVGPNNTQEHTMCQSQKILSTAYVSFKVFGIAFIFIVGGLVIIFSYALEPIMSCLQRRYGKFRRYNLLEWAANDVLQLQRLAYEEAGMGTWRGSEKSVPVTESGETLGPLDLSNPKHPRLRSSTTGLSEVTRDDNNGRVKTLVTSDSTSDVVKDKSPYTLTTKPTMTTVSSSDTFYSRYSEGSASGISRVETTLDTPRTDDGAGTKPSQSSPLCIVQTSEDGSEVNDNSEEREYQETSAVSTGVVSPLEQSEQASSSVAPHQADDGRIPGPA
ncbi:hypothetical protein VP1G_06720 [Cytospora mali]|uniref:Uncharacterized protein n=1 Tax=Cytospora mali TaxID=578113 RepID=A0A194V6I3_CYTMA|nr:hypothetical protein VP1G_06720 [Valsa mali var. pyri (nom. inval.)]